VPRKTHKFYVFTYGFTAPNRKLITENSKLSFVSQQRYSSDEGHCKENSDFPICNKSNESVVSKINVLNPAIFSNDKSYKNMSASNNGLLYYFSFV
jgi:hypothetical protein